MRGEWHAALILSVRDNATLDFKENAMFLKISLPLAAAVMMSTPVLADTNAAASATASATASAALSGSFNVAQIQTYLDVVAQLEQRGYSVIAIERTLLGRMKVRARNEAHLRELVVSRHTGEVMHDIIVQVYAENDTKAETADGAEATGDVSLGVDAGVDVKIGKDDESDDSRGGASVDVGVGVDVGAGGGVTIGN
jgi:hypothetical protein